MRLPRTRFMLSAALVAYACALPAAAQAPDGHQYIRLRAKVEQAQLNPPPYRFAWHQANSLTKDVSAEYNGVVLNPNQPGRVLEWRITHRSDPSVEFMTQTATVVGDVWRFEFAPDESTFTPGTYAGYVRTYKTDGEGVVTQSLMIAEEVLTVRASPGWEDKPVIGPITGPFVRMPEDGDWPDGYILTREDGKEVAVPMPEGGPGGGGDGSLNPEDFVDTDSVTWSKTNDQLRAHAQAGTVLRKSGINLMGVYRLGDSLKVVGDEIDTAFDPIDPDGLTRTFGEPVDGLSAPIWQGPPYEHATWRLVPNFGSLPDSGDPQALWWDPINQVWFLDQPYAYFQPPLDTNVVQIGTNVAAYSFTGATNTFIVPPGVELLQVKLWGQAGANNTTAARGGSGGFVSGYLPVTSGETLSIVVPGHALGADYQQGGFGGGGGQVGANRAGGGGAAIIFRGTNVLAVAGGGGGAGASSFAGNGGGLVGVSADLGPGTGGTQSAGGSQNGAFLQGGIGVASAGAGGGGYYGGGGGSSSNGGGGGGSSYIAKLLFAFTLATNFSDDDDYAAGVGAPSASTLSPGGPGRIVLRW